MRILVIDLGGTHMKVLATGYKTPVKIPSGPHMTAAKMVAAVRAATVTWKYEAVSIGYPGSVAHGSPVMEHRSQWPYARFQPESREILRAYPRRHSQ